MNCLSSRQSPALWGVDEVLEWATRVKLSVEGVEALVSNEVDGPTLITLSKTELKSELGITPLPVRRYLWELIKSLEEEQKANDLSVALEVHEQEIQTFYSDPKNNNKGGPDVASSGFSHIDSSLKAVVYEMQSDAQKQRQLVDDHIMGTKYLSFFFLIHSIKIHQLLSLLSS